jgi:hypothetical protein
MRKGFLLRGEFKDNIIVFKPDVSVLNSRPAWAKQPGRSDL